ncbi:MAG: vitamin K epoxide reductase family protein [Pyrinomonadaceae bacterium]|nr:vitamin K epoxide reductase family protein [Pyrinomonadaceae bacterium]
MAENDILKTKWLPVLAAVFAMIGLGDSVYLTVHHYTGEKVPCSLVTGCETVLSSQYAEMFGIPTAAFGAIAYFVVFSLAILTLYGNRAMWNLLGAFVSVMAVFTLYLMYLQAFVIEAFCQFCLISAATTLSLLALFLFSKFSHRR